MTHHRRSRPGRPGTHDLLVLSGGRGSRLGGLDKAGLDVAGVPLLERVLAAAPGARRVVVVGPHRATTRRGVEWTREDPPDGGPVAGVIAGLERLGRPAVPWVLVVAVDQPEAASALAPILVGLDQVPDEIDAVCHQDADGFPQWLLAAYRSTAVRAALAPLGSGHGVPVRRAVSTLRFQHPDGGTEYIGDIDTWDDHRRWQRILGGAECSE